MEITSRKIEQVNVLTIHGDVDGATAPEVQASVIANATPGCKMILDMTDVGYMSSAGLRMLLVTYRTVVGQDGSVILVGLSDDLKDTMEMTGFLDFFKCQGNVDAALADLAD